MQQAVSKPMPDHVTIAGYDGGTGASPMSSIKHAGLPWKLDLLKRIKHWCSQVAWTHAVQVDWVCVPGAIVIIGALLGAMSLACHCALIVSGCLMMRKCHLNTCPVGSHTRS